MSEVIIYLLESSIALGCLYLIYVLALRKETFFNLNRFYLLGILVFSLLFPFMSFDFSPPESPIDRPVEEIGKLRKSYYESLAEWEFESLGNADSANQNELSGSEVVKTNWLSMAMKGLMVIYLAGVAFCWYRTLWTFKWLYQMIRLNPKVVVEGIRVIQMPKPIGPFSFLNNVFVHEEASTKPEFEQILAHEKIHIQQRHSIDLIFVQLLAAFLWFNPVVWRLIKSLKTTHEYIADEKVINTGYSLVAYQTMLLKQLISNNSYGLVHNFNLSFIKKRITMMTNNKSGWSGKVKVSMAIVFTVLLGAFIVQCNSTSEEPGSIEVQAIASALADKVQLPVLLESELNSFVEHNRILDVQKETVLNLYIYDDQVIVNGKNYETGDLKGLVEKSQFPDQGVLKVQVDADQKMGFVRDVFSEFRRLNKRKVLYVAKSKAGDEISIRFLMPPTREFQTEKFPAMGQFPEVEGEFANVNSLYLFEADEFKTPEKLRNDIYDFVKEHVDNGSPAYVVSMKYANDDSYGCYLTNLVAAKGAFHQIYQERAQQMFGKDFVALEQDEYRAVRKGVPMAISIAD